MSKILTWCTQTHDFLIEDQLGVPDDYLPVTNQQLASWLSLPLDHPEGPASSAKSLSWGTRVGIRARAVQDPLPHDLRIHWSRAASRFAPFTQRSGQWALQQYRIVHQVAVSTWAIEEFLVTEQDMRFFTLPDRGPVTASEFQFIYEQTPLEHLQHHQEQERDRLQVVADQFVSPLLVRELTISNQQGQVETRRVTCLTASTPADWRLQPGEHLLDSRPILDTVP